MAPSPVSFAIKASLTIIAGLFLCLSSGCEETVASPKPRAYPRVVYPAKEYAPFKENFCAFSFDLPKYAVIERDTDFFGERPKSDCWFNIQVPQINASIYCSYYPIKSRKDFDEMVADAFSITNKHTVKANYIEEIPISRPADKVHGVVFNVEGAVASSYQFFLTDSTQHFLRGALYFNTQARPDSLAPVAAFMRQDLDRIVRTLTWNN